VICIMLILDPRSTALVLIDLQNGIIGTPLAPRSGRDVLATATAFAKRFRAAGAPVVLVHFALAMITRRAPPTCGSAHTAPSRRIASGWSDLGGGLAEAGDIGITKRQWGAFYGTELTSSFDARHPDDRARRDRDNFVSNRPRAGMGA